MSFPEEINSGRVLRGDPKLRRVNAVISKTLERDRLVEQSTQDLQQKLGVDRVVLYYFYRQWKGQVTFEALSDPSYSIFGSTGPDACFNDEYAALYLAGRVRAIADIETDSIAECHRDFLRTMQVRANLVVPVLTIQGLWGLLVAHHCQAARSWIDADISDMQRCAEALAIVPSIRGSRKM
ncbi:MAG: GAF domain-containing protein [Stenomitos rutilans HA7619-LM2]|jgi:GAF domain-containing protein|nr:GAF domain-containing protein [Stenomitos rutilans HA7619-LM2]